MNSISVKLFLALFGLTSLVLIASIGLARWNFNYGFYDYLNSVQEQRLEGISDELVKYYNANDGHWGADIQRYFSAVILPENFLNDNRMPRQQSSTDEAWMADDNAMSYQSVDMAARSHQPGMAVSMESAAQQFFLDSGLPFPPKNSTLLLDANGAVIAKTRSSIGEADFISLPIKIDNQVIGELRAVSQPEQLTPTENAFSVQQKLVSVLIVVVSLALAAIASWLLSRMMLAPIVKIKNSIAKLANGEYKSRLDIGRNDELGMLMKDVNKLGSSLQRNRESRRHFLADISHELRTPMTVLGGEIEALKDGVRPLDMHSVDSLGHEVSRLKVLIDDLYQLSLSDIGGLRYEFEAIELSDWLSKILGQHINRAEQAGLQLQVSTQKQCRIKGDKQRLAQLITNLINNSIAYTDSSGIIRVSLTYDGEHVLLVFADSGPGVSEEQLSLMFEPLFRAEESRNRRGGGAGLGLTICRNIVAAHDASIAAVASSLGGVAIEIRFMRL